MSLPLMGCRMSNPKIEGVLFGLCGLLILTVAVFLPYVVTDDVSELRPVVAFVGSVFTSASIAGWFISIR